MMQEFETSDYVKEFYPPLYGLVLAGGQSKRMGQDKALIDYHGVPQVVKSWTMLAERVERCYISARAEQLDGEIERKYPQLYDRYENIGPFAGILRAMEEHPEAAWLVLACDLPYIEDEVIAHLIKHRNPHKLATAYRSAHDELPEPLCAIWEPSMKSRIYDVLEVKMYCPRKLLINSDITLLNLTSPVALDNCNTPEEYRQAKKQIVSTENL